MDKINTKLNENDWSEQDMRLLHNSSESRAIKDIKKEDGNFINDSDIIREPNDIDNFFEEDEL